MKQPFAKEKEQYLSTPIPENLSEKIQQVIPKPRAIRKKRYIFPKVIGSLAACCAAFIFAVNTNTVFAESIYKIPVLGDFAKVVTFKQYQSEDNIKIVNVKIPALQETGNNKLENKINQEIRNKIDLLVEESKQHAQEYYDAFMETGGKQEDFLPVDIVVDYEVKHSDDNQVSFVVTRFEGSFSAYTEKYYYNIDLATGKELTLKDVLGENYKEKANTSIQQQIQQQMKDESSDKSYFVPEDLTGLEFKSIRDDQGFYINEDGKTVIVFDKYEIAPGYMGFPEFVIE